MLTFTPGAPARLHAPGKPWHKVRVRLREQLETGAWVCYVRSWTQRALKANPMVGAQHVVTVYPECIRLIPGYGFGRPA